MRTMNFTLLAVVSCIATTIGAIPIEHSALSGSIARRQRYVPLPQQLHGENGCSDSTGIKNLSLALHAKMILM
jgi:hypothetical protein